MRKFIILMAIIVSSAATATAQAITTFDADKFHFALSEEEKPQLLDVRTKQEYKAGHLPGAINIDVNAVDFQKKVAKKFSKDKIVFVYCRSGMRSLNAANILEKMDFKIIYNLKGGIKEWEQKGKTVKRSNDKGNL